MKTKKHFVPVVVVFILIAGFLVHARSKKRSPTLDEIQLLEDALMQARIKEVSPIGKMTNRSAFLEGVFFSQRIIGHIRNIEGPLLGLRALRDRKDILVGMESVVVVVNVDPEAEKYDVTKKLLQNDTELRLRTHGIKVGKDVQPQDEKVVEQTGADAIIRLWQQAIDAKSDEDFLQSVREWVRRDFLETYQLSGQLPVLYINFNTIVDEGRRDAVFSIRVELQEGAYLCRNGALFCDAPVWKKGVGIGTCSPNDLKDYVRECLRDIVDMFINDYIAANPKDR